MKNNFTPRKSNSYKLVIFLLLLIFNSCSKKVTEELLPVDPVKTDQKEMPKIINSFNIDDLPFEDTRDFVNANKGFIATRKDPLIKNKKGKVVMDLERFDFMKKEAPATVNASLWRQGQLNSIHGLFEVCEGIYQIRGFDLANMTLVASENGWIIIDVLTSEEVAAAAMELVEEHLGKRPVKAVIITHSHIDHFGGINGVVSQEEVTAGTVEIIAPEGFYESSISENILAGNGMSRRAMYMFGTLLPTDSSAFIGNGLGQSVSVGTYGILKPTTTIQETGQQLNIDGIDIIFQNTPGAEAPAECMFYFPQYKAFCQAEEINHTLHNLYTLRGAEVRNGLKWAKYIDESIQLFGEEVEISFGSHHWPTWGKKDIHELWKKQRDVYKFIHDQTLYLANNGYTMLEIAEMIQLPKSLSSYFANRGYYGTLSHNAKAQYQLYYGWFDGNPATLHALPPTEAATKYVEYMGGSAQILEKVQQDIDKGEYRWAAMVLNHLIFAEPKNQSARNLLAKTYQQLAIRAESGPWRNFYLTGAQELQEGIITKHSFGSSSRADIITKMSLENFYDYMAVRLDRTKAVGKEYTFNLIFPDVNETISLYLENEVLHNRPGVLAENPTATITMDRSVFNDLITNKAIAKDKMVSGEIKIEGNPRAYGDFQQMVAKRFDLLFNIIEP